MTPAPAPPSTPLSQPTSVIAPAPAPPAAVSSTPVKEEEEDEITLKLKKLKTLFDKQLITQEEYENKKREVLSSL